MPLKEEMGREKAKRKSGAPGEIRTPDLLLRRQSLYPSELRAHSSRFQFTCAVRKHQRDPTRLTKVRADSKKGSRSTIVRNQTCAGQQNAAAGKPTCSRET